MNKRLHPQRALLSWALYDWGNSAYSAIIQTFIFATYFVQQVAENKQEGAALWGMTIGLVGLVIAIGGPVVGALADQGGRRKAWLAACTALCAGSSLLSWYVYPSPSSVQLALLLICLGTISSEFAYVFYNAMLPELAPADKIGRWSGWGWSLGYVGGTASLIIALYAFITPIHPWIALDRAEAVDVRATFVLTGAWVILFSAPLFLFTPRDVQVAASFKETITASFKDLRNTITLMKQYTWVMRFFIARMFYTDGLTTLFAFGGIYAATRFNFTESEILLFGIALNVTAGIGAALFAFFDDLWGSKEIIIVSLLALVVLSTLAITTDDLFWFWFCGLTLGVFVGPVQASSRSYLARWAPPALRNQMFGFFTLTGRATAFLGPTLVGWITYWTGELALGMGIIVAFYGIGLILIWPLPSDRPKLKNP